MTRRTRHSMGWFPRLRHLGSVTLATAGIVLGSATMAAAYFTLTHLGTGAARAGAIGAPTSFTATSAFPNQATLSWTPPSDHAPTGYTLTQSPGTLTGTCTTLSAGSVSCTATGLAQDTTYTWHLVADDHSWSSPPVSVTKTTIAPSVALTPVSGYGGTSVKVTGSGFAATSGLTFSFTPSGGTAGALSPTNCPLPVTTTGTGALPATPCEITIPTTSAIGAGTVKVSDAAGNSATATFTVTPLAGGLGTMTVTPPTAVASSTGNTFEFDFTAGVGGLTQGTVALTIPPGWTVPSTTKGSAGYVTLTPTAAGTLAITGASTIKVTGVTLAAGKGFAIVYGTGGGATGVTVPSTVGTATFATMEAPTSTGTPAAIATPPKVNVIAAPCAPITGTHTLTAGATTHFSLRGASGGNGGNTGGGTGAGGTIITGTLTNTSGATLTFTYTLGCKGAPGEIQTGGAGGIGYVNGGSGGTGHSNKAGGGGGGGGASALTFTAGSTTTVVAVAGGGGGGAGEKFGEGVGGGNSSPTKVAATTTTLKSGGPGTSPGNDSTNGGAGGGGGGGGVHLPATGGGAGAGGTGGTSYVHGIGTFTGVTFSNVSIATGTNGATATIGFT